MNKKKIMLVFGTRPEAIKMAPLVKQFEKNSDKFETIVCVTAQHREMLDQVLDLFEITPDYDLNLMKQGQDLYDITSRVLLGMRDVFMKSRPDLVFVHGDTTTSTATALAAFYQQIPIAHVEAGLRTHNLLSPWPEEANRQITGRLADYNFAPTALSKQNLLDEGIPEHKIFVTGNTVIDALYMVLYQIKNKTDIKQTVETKLIDSGLSMSIVQYYMQDEFTKVNLSNTGATTNKNTQMYVDICCDNSENSRKLIMITGHRRESFGEGFINICNAIKILAEKNPNVDFIYPMHLNPNVRKPINEVFGSAKNIANIHFIEPLEYLPFVYLMSKSYLVLTDSGGIQEEAPGLGKPVVVMRDTTERPEAVDAGTVKLVGTNMELIVSEISKLIDDKVYYISMSKANNPYGDGKACKRIVEAN